MRSWSLTPIYGQVDYTCTFPYAFMACTCTLVTIMASFGLPSYSHMTDTFSLLELYCEIKIRTSLLYLPLPFPIQPFSVLHLQRQQLRTQQRRHQACDVRSVSQSYSVTHYYSTVKCNTATLFVALTA